MFKERVPRFLSCVFVARTHACAFKSMLQKAQCRSVHQHQQKKKKKKCSFRLHKVHVSLMLLTSFCNAHGSFFHKCQFSRLACSILHQFCLKGWLGLGGPHVRWVYNKMGGLGWVGSSLFCCEGIWVQLKTRRTVLGDIVEEKITVVSPSDAQQCM